jgi:O-antigen ligase
LHNGIRASGAVIAFLVLPALALWGGSTDLLNWGPGLLIAGAACLWLLRENPESSPAGRAHSLVFLLLLGLLYLRARYSPDASASANNAALIALAAAGFLLGRLAGTALSRALCLGLAVAAMLNLFCTVMQLGDGRWDLVYPERSGGVMPSGLFAHYSYSAAFCLGALGMLLSRGVEERGWLRWFLTAGAVCALATVPLSPSRGGNLALALLVAVAVALLLARAFWKSGSLMSMWLPALMLLFLVLVFASAFVPLIDRDAGIGGFYGDGVRLAYWNAATQIAASHPWLGGGAGSFAWNVFHVLDDLTTEPGLVHNEALQLAVDYGYPALLAMAMLMGAPLLLGFWRFVNQTDAVSAWAALGLMAMLFQANFESIFHSAPGAFVAALILGRVNRGLWTGTGAFPKALPRDPEEAEFWFLSDVKARVDDYANGKGEALTSLMGLLSRSKLERWWKGYCRLGYWEKVHDEQALSQAVAKLGVQATEELARHSSRGIPPEREVQRVDPPRKGKRIMPLLPKFALAACSLFILVAGFRVTLALRGAWEPLYYPDRVTVTKRFVRLIDLAGKHPGLGIDREVLSAGLKCIHHYKSQAAREYWANAYRPRIVRDIPGWRTDPGAALQLAEIAGWAGDHVSALDLYDHAIAIQGKNEMLFMARAFKGQYLYELSVSAGAAGQKDQQLHFANLASGCFENAAAAMGEQRRLHQSFAWMLQQSQNLLDKPLE